MGDRIALQQVHSERVGDVERIVIERIYVANGPTGPAPEPCEFTSAELIKIARDEIASARQLMSYDDVLVDDQLQNAEQALAQAAAQLKYNNGAATPFPEAKDPWEWDDADTYGCSA